jgi:uncharacterized protein (TIGR00255 family)
MTGFSRAEGQHGDTVFAWELKSVNGKGLEIRFRLPPGYDGLEPQLRASLSQRVRRGNVNVSLALARSAGNGGLRINRQALAEVLAAVRELQASVNASPPSADGLLSLRGVLEAGEPEETAELREARLAAATRIWEPALGALVRMREEEGARLRQVLEERLGEIASLTSAAEATAAAQPEAMRERLRTLLGTLMQASPPLTEDRLAQELAVVVARGDVREELDRLNAHIAAARALLEEGTAVGRRFDFLCQEFNREANTLCSKSADIELTRIGLALKASIEQLREQVQNIE